MNEKQIFAMLLVMNLFGAYGGRLKATTVRDMVELQIPGTYTRVSLTSEPTVCSASITITQVEVHSISSKPIFVVPHSYQQIPSTPNGSLSCLDVPVTQNPLTNVTSATILRRSRDVPPDRRIPLFDKLAQAGENYYVGYEHGGRICNDYRVPDGTTSIWAAPSQRITSRFFDLLVAIEPGEKYIFFFSSPPCMYIGNASMVGKVIVIPSPTPSVNVTANNTTQTNQTQQPDCFPGDATTLAMSNGAPKTVRIESLMVDDVVADGIGGWTRVLAHTHTQSQITSRMVSISAGNHTLKLSGGHLVVTPKKGTIRAADIRIGDILYAAGKRRHQLVVDGVSMVNGVGLYAPVTSTGTMAVNGMLVTTYAIEMTMAHALLAPLRTAPCVLSTFVQSVCEIGRRMIFASSPTDAM